MTALSSVTARQICPSQNISMYLVTYIKTNATDFITINAIVDSTSQNEPLTPMKTARFAMATDDTAGAVDPITFSSVVKLSMSSGTGAGRMLIVGNC